MNDLTPRPLLTQAADAKPERDPDPQETAEWREAFEALLATQGPARARQMLGELSRVARSRATVAEDQVPCAARTCGAGVSVKNVVF